MSKVQRSNIQKRPFQPRRLTWLLLCGFIAALVFLCTQILQYNRHSLQMDFSAYYTAGQSLNQGLSPYVNNIVADPSLWDGVSHYTTSRFLYPPLVANFFQIVALLPYSVAKIVWSILNLISLFAALYLFNDLLLKEKSYKWNIILLAGILTCLFFPTFSYFERGQIDAITLVFLILMVKYLMEGKAVKGGVFFVLAVLIKINILVLAPIFLISRYRRVIPSILISLMVVGGLTVALNPWQLIKHYLTVDFPRIIEYNEHGPLENLLPEAVLVQANEDYPLDTPQKDGITYQSEAFSFLGNASLVRTEWGETTSEQLARCLRLPSSLALSAILYLLLVGLICIVVFPSQWLQSRQDEAAIWGLMLTVLLLISPLTWVMNLIWLVILFPLMINQLFTMFHPNPLHNGLLNIITVLLGFTGIVVMGVPDAWLLIPDVDISASGWVNKYPAGELLVICWLIFLLLSQKWKTKNGKQIQASKEKTQ